MSEKERLVFDIIQALTITYCVGCEKENECDQCPVQNAMIGASNGI